MNGFYPRFHYVGVTACTLVNPRRGGMGRDETRGKGWGWEENDGEGRGIMKEREGSRKRGEMNGRKKVGWRS